MWGGVTLYGLLLAAAACRGRKVKADNDADANYDRAARELAFEAKGQVGVGTTEQLS